MFGLDCVVVEHVEVLLPLTAADGRRNSLRMAFLAGARPQD